MNTAYEQQSTLMTNMITGNNKRNKREHTRSKFKKKPSYYNKKANKKVNKQENERVVLQYNYENMVRPLHLYTIDNHNFDAIITGFIVICSMIVLMIINRVQI